MLGTKYKPEKGQASTEYIVIMAIALILALVVVNAMGSYFKVGATATDTGVKTYYKTTEIGLMDWSINDAGTDYFAVRNNAGDTITLTSATVGGVNLLSSPLTLKIGETATMTGEVGDGGEIRFDYTTGSGLAKTFTGLKPLRTKTSSGTDGGTGPATTTIACSDIIIDNTDSVGYSEIGSWVSSTSAAGYYNTDYRHDGSGIADPGESATFTPSFAVSGSYQVYLWWTEGVNRPDAAPLMVSHNNGVDTSQTVNQQTNGGQWNFIGTYYFAPGQGHYVKIMGDDNGYTIADAVKFECV